MPIPSGLTSVDSPLPRHDKRRRVLTPDEEYGATVVSTCRGCRDDLANQLGHMEHGGCMYPSPDEETLPPLQEIPPLETSFWSLGPATRQILNGSFPCEPHGSFAGELGPVAISLSRNGNRCDVALRGTKPTPEFEVAIEATRDGESGVFVRRSSRLETTLVIPWEEGAVNFRIQITDPRPGCPVPFWDDESDIQHLCDLYERASSKEDDAAVDAVLDAVKRGLWSADDAVVVWEEPQPVVDAFLGSKNMREDGETYAAVLGRMGERDYVPAKFATSMLRMKRKR